MKPTIAGLHHVTAICGDPNPNAHFYVELLGLRLVKYTVNHDDPTTPHLYYGDNRGTPGTNITFFPWTSDKPRGRMGSGQTQDTAYLIRPASLDYWRRRLEEQPLEIREFRRFDEIVLAVSDPDDINIELVASPAADAAQVEPWSNSPVPEEHQLRGFHGVTLAITDLDPTRDLLTDILGYEAVARSSDRVRLQAPEKGPGSIVDLVQTERPRGRVARGSVHHVAFKVADADEQTRLRRALADRGLRVTESIDRLYFRSIYCREPGGVLFEFATMGPGFTYDEAPGKLGSRLVLPEHLEGRRDEIEAGLPDFRPPELFRK